MTMKYIKKDAMQILAEVSMEQNDGDVVQSYNDIKLIDDLMCILSAKSLINHTKGRRPNKEKRFDEVFRHRLMVSAELRNKTQINLKTLQQ